MHSLFVLLDGISMFFSGYLCLWHRKNKMKKNKLQAFYLYNFSVCLLNAPCQELSYEISGDNAALYIIIFFLIENFTMAIALTAASGRSMGSWWLL